MFEIYVEDLRAKMLEMGIKTTVMYCFDSVGDVVSFEIKIVGYVD